MKTYRRGPVAVLAVTTALAAGVVAPSGASAAVSVSVTGDAGTPIALGAPLNMRNMNPLLGISSTAADHFNLSVVGPSGAKVATDLQCFSNYQTSQKPIDYVGNGTYTVVLTTFTNTSCTTGATTTNLPFTITASTALGQPTSPVLTRKAGSIIPNTILSLIHI